MRRLLVVEGDEGGVEEDDAEDEGLEVRVLHQRVRRLATRVGGWAHPAHGLDGERLCHDLPPLALVIGHRLGTLVLLLDVRVRVHDDTDEEVENEHAAHDDPG